MDRAAYDTELQNRNRHQAELDKSEVWLKLLGAEDEAVKDAAAKVYNSDLRESVYALLTYEAEAEADDQGDTPKVKCPACGNMQESSGIQRHITNRKDATHTGWKEANPKVKGKWPIT